MRKRRFIQGSIQHIYQRSDDKGIIFYNEKDFLVLFTILCTHSRKLEIRIGAICFMFNHFHILGKFSSRIQTSRFMQMSTSLFAREYNLNLKRSGKLFHRHFGSASKKEAKKIRTAFAYVYNNPVEKGLCTHAENYRWNFMAYHSQTHPFSEVISSKDRSLALREALRTVNALYAENKYIGYLFMNHFFKKIHKKNEREFLIDHIISTYSAIDIKLPLEYFPSYGNMLTAIHSNTGSEYDMDEEWYPDTDTVIFKLLEIAKELGFYDRNMNFKDMDIETKISICKKMAQNSKAGEYQLSKFLHLDRDIIHKNIQNLDIQ